MMNDFVDALKARINSPILGYVGLALLPTDSEGRCSCANPVLRTAYQLNFAHSLAFVFLTGIFCNLSVVVISSLGISKTDRTERYGASQF